MTYVGSLLFPIQKVPCVTSPAPLNDSALLPDFPLYPELPS